MFSFQISTKEFYLIPEATLSPIFTRLVHQIRDSIPALALGYAILVKCRSIEITPSTAATLKLLLSAFGRFEYS